MFFLRALAIIAALFLVSCGSGRLSMPGFAPYRIEIQQGNFISQEMVSQLKLGMSKDQVRFVLGTPLIADSFHADRWDYVFRRQKVNSRELEHRTLTVFFEDSKLKRVDGDVKPAASTDAAGVKTPEAKPEMQLAPATETPQSRPDARSPSDAVKPAQASVPVKSDLAPLPPADKQPRD
jgi:outer membrane protein assembly factor BamE